MEKRKITLTVIVAAVLLVALIGGTYAYWTANTESKNSVQATIQTGTLSLILDDVDGITKEDKIDANHTEIVKYFKLTNNGVGDAYANLIWKGLLNTFVRDDLVYELEEVQADKTSFADKRMVVIETVVPKTSTNENISLANGILVKAGTITNNIVTPNIQYYKLTVKYKYSETENQNEDLNKVLVSGFDLGEGVQQKVRLTLNIGDGATISSNTADVTYTGTYEDLPTPTKEGYKFGGWYTDSAYTNRVLSTSMVSTTNSQELYAKWDKKKLLVVDDSGNEITNLTSLEQGTRIKIGTEYFRYLRTTSTTSNLNECGTTSSIACPDEKDGNLRFLAEKNLLRTETGNASTLILSNALQDPNDYDRKNNVLFSQTDNIYSTSYLKTFMDNYASVINNIIGETNAVKANPITFPELQSLGWGCPSNGNCTNIPTWAKNSKYWLGSPSSAEKKQVYRMYNGSVVSIYCPTECGFGARPVIEIDPSLLL